MVDPRISSITSGGTLVAPKDMSLKYPKGGDGLTVKQRMFVKIFTENEGRLTPTECARQQRKCVIFITVKWQEISTCGGCYYHEKGGD